MSRTTLGADRSEGFTNHRGNRFFREVLGPASATFDQDIKLLIGEGLKNLVNALDSRPGCQKERKKFLRKFLL